MDELYYNSLYENLSPAMEVAESLSSQATLFESAYAAQEALANSCCYYDYMEEQSAFIDTANAIAASLEPIAEQVEAISQITASAATAALETVSEAIQEVVHAFDFTGIVKAFMESVQKLFSNDWIDEMIEQILENTRTIAHTFLHWLMSGFGIFKRKERRRKLIYLPILKVAILCPCVKELIISFHERIVLIMNVYLHRSQDRGTSNDGEEHYLYAVTC